MITAGCDVGSLTVKAVIMKNDEILGSELIPAGAEAVHSAQTVMDKLLGKLNLSIEDIDFCISTGYGRKIIPFANDNMSEISCHAKGAHFLSPSIRTIIDIGGQDYKAIKVDENGKLVTFLMNEQCAAGTGRTTELAAESLGVDVSEIGPLSLESSNPVHFNFVCSFLIQIEVRQLILEDANIADIAAGINNLTAGRVAGMTRKLPHENDITMTGGLAKNVGVVKVLEEKLDAKFVQLPYDPQIVGALGAAVFAANKAKNNCSKQST